MITMLLLSGLLVVADTGRGGGGSAYRVWEGEWTGSGSAASATLPLPGPVRTPTLTLTQDKWFGEDKLKHFAFSFAITAGVAGVARTMTGSHESMIAGAAIGAAAGIAKEIYDRKSGGSPSLRDLFWDVAGVGAAVLVAQQAK